MSDITEQDINNMSDEEFAEFEAQDMVDGDYATEEAEAEPEVAEEEVVETEEVEDTTPTDEPADEDETLETSDEAVDTEEENTPSDSDEAEFNYQSSYEELMAPIKANGSEVTIRDAADARKLIQMGLNYDEKMVAIKPVRLAGKALEKAGIIQNGVINEDALNRMIDFNNGNIDVVKARLKELDIDPLDLDMDDIGSQPQNHMVSEHSVQIDDIQRELDSRGTADQVVTALDSMDDGSREFFSQNPNAILGLEQDVSSGVFTEINALVQYERRMGRLGGKTDMDAYKEFAVARNQQLAENNNVQAPTQTRAPKKTVNTAKRQKAAGGKSTTGSQTANAINPFDLSDDEFEKQFGMAQALR